MTAKNRKTGSPVQTSSFSCTLHNTYTHYIYDWYYRNFRTSLNVRMSPFLYRLGCVHYVVYFNTIVVLLFLNVIIKVNGTDVANFETLQLVQVVSFEFQYPILFSFYVNFCLYTIVNLFFTHSFFDMGTVIKYFPIQTLHHPLQRSMDYWLM